MKKRIFAALAVMIVAFSFGTNLMASFAPSQWYEGSGGTPTPPPSGGGGGGSGGGGVGSVVTRPVG